MKKIIAVASLALTIFTSACATTAPATNASTTDTTSAEVTRLREQRSRDQEEIARLRRLHTLEMQGRAEQAQAAPATLTPQTARPVAPPPAMAIPAMPPLCPGVDPSFGLIPPGMMAVTETMGISRGGRIRTDADTHDVWVNMPPAFYVSVEINGRVMSQFTGASGTPTMLVVRHPRTQGLCRMPAVGGPTTTIRFVPDSFDEGQELTVHVWRAVTDATGTRVAQHTSQCVKDPRWTHSVVGVNDSGRCS